MKQGKKKLRFPILPTEITFSDGNNNTVVNLVGNRGDINLIGNRQLRTVTLSGTFPKGDKYVKGAQYDNIPSGHKCVLKIMDMLRNDGGKVYLLLTGVNKGWFTIQSFEHSLKPGGHYSYSLSLKQYVKPKFVFKNNKVKAKGKVVISAKIKAATTKRVSKAKSGTVTYVVKKGDTLSKIAKKLTGSASNYLAIAKQNNISNPSKLKIGKKLVIKID